MATDPTQRIQRHPIDTELTTDLRAIGERIAAIAPSTDVPIVTATLDWRIEGTNPGRSPFYAEGTRPDDDRYRSQPNRAGTEQGEESARRRPARRVFKDKMDALVEAHGDDDAALLRRTRQVEQRRRVRDTRASRGENAIHGGALHAKGRFRQFRPLNAR